jgi:hypothetical protein
LKALAGSMEIRHLPITLPAFTGNKIVIKKFTILAMIFLPPNF